MKILHLLNVITAYKPTPFAKVVKLATKVEHDRIEKHPFVDNLIAGKLTDAQYACYLLNLIPIYESIERHLNLCGDLLRSNIMRSDLLKYQKSLGPLGDMYFYHKWLENINSANKLTTMSNFYIRWLGDLYGGQILAKNIKFNQHLKFKNVRHSIRQARDLIELNAKNQDTEFVSLIKKAYSFNYDLVDNLYNHVC